MSNKLFQPPEWGKKDSSESKENGIGSHLLAANSRWSLGTRICYHEQRRIVNEKEENYDIVILRAKLLES